MRGGWGVRAMKNERQVWHGHIFFLSSLICVKKHKSEHSCSGIRDKAAFIAREDFDDNVMMSDYSFLENAGRLADTVSNKNSRKQLRTQAMLLLKNSQHSGVRLHLMPVGLSKRTENSSWYNIRKKCIEWQVRWIFPQAEAVYVDERLSEKEILSDLLKKYIDANEGDPVCRQRLKSYCRIPITEICVFLKVEKQPANQLRYHQLNVTETLRQGLHGKTIIEYPTLHVVLPHKTGDYPTGRPSSAKRKHCEIQENPQCSNDSTSGADTQDVLKSRRSETSS